MRDIVIIGSGGLAREVRWLIEECNKQDKRWNILGWITNEPQDTMIAGLPVMGDDEWLISYEKPIDAVVSIGSGVIRRKIVESYRRNPNIVYPNIIAPNVSMSNSVKMGYGNIITFQGVFTVDIQIGNFLISNIASTVGHDCRIHDYVTLFPGVHISGDVSLGECVSIGTGANILQGLSIGDNTFIGAGAAVVRNIPANCTAVGVPAKPLEKRDE